METARQTHRKHVRAGRARDTGIAAIALMAAAITATPLWSEPRSENAVSRFAAEVASAVAADNAGATIAVGAFRDLSSSVQGADLASATTTALTSALAMEEELRLVESRRVADILEAAERQHSGAYDAETAAAVGKLVGASQLVLGEIEKTAQGYNIACRVVTVSTGEIAIARSVSVSNSDLAKLLDSLSPPWYRLRIATAVDQQYLVREPALGVEAELTYEMRRVHNLLLRASFGGFLTQAQDEHRSPADDFQIYVTPRYLVQVAAGYGLLIDATPLLSLRPNVAVGANGFSYRAARFHTLPFSQDGGSELAWTPFVEAAVEALIVRRSPIALFFAAGYRRQLLPFREEAVYGIDSFVLAEPVSTVFGRAGVSLYF